MFRTFDRYWARIVENVVAEVTAVESHLPHPFGEAARVLDVSGVPVAVGYVVDMMGNVGPPAQVAQPLEEHRTDLPTPNLHIQVDPAHGMAPVAPFAPSGTAGTGPSTNVTLIDSALNAPDLVVDGTNKTDTGQAKTDHGTIDGREPEPVASRAE